MTKQQIISQLAEGKVVEEIIKNATKCNDLDFSDLAQDLYLSLLLKDEKKIQEMFENDQLNFYIAKMVRNNWYSTTSPFYTMYKKFKEKTEKIDDGL